MNPAFWRGRSVLVTGHTGFKGGWLSLWLTELGADVHGYALEPPTTPALFSILGLERRMASSTIADIRSSAEVGATIQRVRPEVVFHLAAQPLVRQSYRDPVGTYAVNTMGTVHLLEAVAHTPGIRAVVNVTTDKCYETEGASRPFREDDSLGGYDPYASSKAASELVTAAYRRSFLAAAGVHVATARAGNVIGGGDWAADRLVPDFLRAIDAGEVLRLRSPEATRPWQHVLEPLAGYLTLAEHLCTGGDAFAEAWNFGPVDDDAWTVGAIADWLCRRIPGARWERAAGSHPHETPVLRLDSAKAVARLGWRPRWRIEAALAQTLAWHAAWRRGDDMTTVSLQQIGEYAGVAAA